MRLALELQPDVVIVDLSMPELNGIDATRELRARDFAAPIIMLSGHGDPLLVGKARAAGVSGYIMKQDAFAGLIAAITACAAGGTCFDAPVVPPPLSEPEALAQIALLTPREREVLTLLAQGKSAKVIGDELGLSAKTVSVHRQNLTAKLNVTNLADLARLAVRAGLAKL